MTFLFSRAGVRSFPPPTLRDLDILIGESERSAVRMWFLFEFRLLCCRCVFQYRSIARFIPKSYIALKLMVGKGHCEKTPTCTEVGLFQIDPCDMVLVLFRVLQMHGTIFEGAESGIQESSDF